jgi:two-component system, OmpR family, alkaline phosphatase synthesis response regulator PhoP
MMRGTYFGLANNTLLMQGDKRILLVDDDQDILDLLKYNLEKEGFHVRAINKSQKAVWSAERFLPHLIILDLMMPEIDGLKLCQELRSHPHLNNVYIFFLTAKSGSDFQDIVLSKGADDYIEKMMGIRSLMSKVDCVLNKRLTIRKRNNQIHLGSLELDRETYRVTFNHVVVDLNITEFEILYFFAQNPGKNISVDTIIESLSNTEIYLIEATTRLYIYNIQKKVGVDVIKSAGKFGFRLALTDPLL